MSGGGKDRMENPEADLRTIDGALTLKQRLIRASVFLCSALWATDIIYKIVKDVSYVNREKCVLYKSLPRMWFIFFEYFFETVVIVFVGIFIAVLVGRWFQRLHRFYPTNPITAFFYASVIPLCSCALIPLLSTMKGRMKFATTMSFVLTAPLLSPYILALSFSVLGFTYGLLRIISSFILVITTVFILSFLHRKESGVFLPVVSTGCMDTCTSQGRDVYLETFDIFKKMLPYVLVGGVLGVFIEFLGPRSLLLDERAGRGLAGIAIWILMGVPLYFCNGAEILFLRPLMNHGMPLGTAIAFSLTSTAVCTTSIAMLVRIMGPRLTITLVSCVIVISFSLALLINAVF
jgi:uncharacterized protein